MSRMAGDQLSASWNPCVHFSASRVRQYAVPKITERRAVAQEGRLFVDISGPFNEIFLCRGIFLLMYTGDYTFQFIRFLR